MQTTADIATALWYTGLDIHTKKPFAVARGMRDRKMHRALSPFLKPENPITVRGALVHPIHMT